MRKKNRWEGILEGIRATVRTCRNFNISETDTVRNIMNEFFLSQEEAVNYVNTGKRKTLLVSEDRKARRTTGRSLLLPVVSAMFYMQNTAYKGTIR